MHLVRDYLFPLVTTMGVSFILSKLTKKASYNGGVEDGYEAMRPKPVIPEEEIQKVVEAVSRMDHLTSEEKAEAIRAEAEKIYRGANAVEGRCIG